MVVVANLVKFKISTSDSNMGDDQSCLTGIDHFTKNNVIVTEMFNFVENWNIFKDMSQIQKNTKYKELWNELFINMNIASINSH